MKLGMVRDQIFQEISAEIDGLISQSSLDFCLRTVR